MSVEAAASKIEKSASLDNVGSNNVENALRFDKIMKDVSKDQALGDTSVARLTTNESSLPNVEINFDDTKQEAIDSGASSSNRKPNVLGESEPNNKDVEKDPALAALKELAANPIVVRADLEPSTKEGEAPRQDASLDALKALSANPIVVRADLEPESSANSDDKTEAAREQVSK